MDNNTYYNNENEIQKKIVCSLCGKHIETFPISCNFSRNNKEEQCNEQYCSAHCSYNHFEHIHNHIKKDKNKSEQYIRQSKGINNLGKTCYMSSALQCLSNCHYLALYFLLHKYESSSKSLSKEFCKILINLYTDDKNNVIDITNFRKEIGIKNKEYLIKERNDSNNFLIDLINYLCEENEDKLLEHYLFGYFKCLSQCECKDNTQGIKTEKFLTIFLPLCEPVYLLNYNCEKTKQDALEKKIFRCKYDNLQSLINYFKYDENIKNMHFYLINTDSITLLDKSSPISSSNFNYERDNQFIISYQYKDNNKTKLIFCWLYKRSYFKNMTKICDFPVCFQISTEDINELLSKINQLIKNKPYFLAFNDYIISFELLKHIIGEEPKFTSIKVVVENDTDIDIDKVTFSSSIKMEEFLNYFFQNKPIYSKQSERYIECNKCHQTIYQQYFLNQLPIYLFFFLIRDQNKNINFVYPNEIDITKYLSKDIPLQNKKMIYELIGVNEYSSTFFNLYKHYKSRVLIKGNWICFDDDEYKTEREALTQKAVLLVYQRKID